MNTKAIPTYLLIFGLLALGACTTDYLITIDLQYVNDTDSTVAFNIRDGDEFLTELEILPGVSSPVLRYEMEGSRELDPEVCCSGLISNLFETGDGVYLQFDDSLCLYQRDGIFDVSNYTYEQLDQRHVRYTYTFDSNDLEGAAKCN